ncbi:hypothetical protein TNCV_4618481 [Trichonephila clavipes]|nr:hypothetical protein TNCV_4618481 [Trichonephila clavipes]
MLQPQYPSGHGHKIEAGDVAMMMSLKTRHVEGLMLIKSVMDQSPHVGMVGMLGEWGGSSSVFVSVTHNKPHLPKPQIKYPKLFYYHSFRPKASVEESLTTHYASRESRETGNIS